MIIKSKGFRFNFTMLFLSPLLLPLLWFLALCYVTARYLGDLTQDLD